VPDTHSTGVEQVYATTDDPGFTASHVRIDESTTPEALDGFGDPTAQVPAAGTMAVTKLTEYGSSGSDTSPVGALWEGRLTVDGVYVKIEATSQSLLLDAAHGLAPVG
jgi:hypothetical protein